MPLTLWRRHRSTCKHKTDRYYRKCHCAMWCEGVVDGTYRRHSMKTRSWETAEGMKDDIEEGVKPKIAPVPVNIVTVERAYASFFAYRGTVTQNVSVLGKYRLLGERLLEYAKEERITDIKDFKMETVVDFKSKWTGSPRTLQKLWWPYSCPWG